MTTQRKAMIALSFCAITSSVYAATQNLLAYITRDYPAVDPLTVVTLMSVPSLAGLVVSLINGPLAMKFSKKMLMIVYSACSCVSLLGFALIGANGPFALLMGAAVVNGLATGGRNPLQSTLVSEFLAPEKRASFLALCAALANGGQALSNWVFGAVGSGNNGADWPKAFYFAFALSLLALITAVVFLPKSSTDAADAQKGEKGFHLNGWKPYRVFAIILLLGILMLGLSSFTLNVSNYIIVEHQLGTAAEAGVASIFLTVSGMVVGFTYGFWSKLFKRFTAAVGFVCIVLGLVSMLLMTSSLVGIYLSGLFIGIGMNLITPFGVAQIMAETPQHFTSIIMSVFTGINFLFVFAAPYILNGVGSLFGGSSSGMAITGIGSGVIGVVLSVILFALKKQDKAQPA